MERCFLIMKKSLLDKAKKIPHKYRKHKEYSCGELELIIAWLNDEVELSQMQEVLKIKAGLGVYIFICMGIRQLWRTKRIVIQ